MNQKSISNHMFVVSHVTPSGSVLETRVYKTYAGALKRANLLKLCFPIPGAIRFEAQINGDVFDAWPVSS